MRLWTLHPEYLDSAGLTALWREGLLAAAVLSGRAEGYRHHPQLIRFRQAEAPLAALRFYLDEVWGEAQRRGYRFDVQRLDHWLPGQGGLGRTPRMEETVGQLLREREHLAEKLRRRRPEMVEGLYAQPIPRAHPLFHLVEGPVRPWEKAAATGQAEDSRKNARPFSPS